MHIDIYDIYMYVCICIYDIYIYIYIYYYHLQVTAAGAVDREFCVYRGSLWGALGIPLAVLGHLGGPFGAPWAPGGPCGSPIRCQAQFGDLANAKVW